MNSSILKEKLETQGCVVIPGLLNSTVLDFLVKSFSSKFTKKPLMKEASSEYSVSDLKVLTRLEIIFNTPDFLRTMSELVGREIKNSKSRLYYVDSSCLSLPWHDDSYDTKDRVAAIRFELSDEVYEGGDFYFKDDIQEFKFSNLKFGEGLLFKIEFEKYYHKVSPVLAGTRKSLIVFLNK